MLQKHPNMSFRNGNTLSTVMRVFRCCTHETVSFRTLSATLYSILLRLKQYRSIHSSSRLHGEWNSYIGETARVAQNGMLRIKFGMTHRVQHLKTCITILRVFPFLNDIFGCFWSLCSCFFRSPYCTLRMRK